MEVEEAAAAADVIWPWAGRGVEKGSRTRGWKAHGWEVQSHRHPGNASRCWLLGGTNCKGVWRGGPGKGGPLVRTGDKRPNLEVEGEEELPQLLLSTAMGSEGELARWAEAQVWRKENRGRRVLGTLEGSPLRRVCKFV